MCEDFGNEYLRARQYYDKALTLEPNNELVLKNLANNYFYNGDFEPAMKTYKSILEKNKSFAQELIKPELILR